MSDLVKKESPVDLSEEWDNNTNVYYLKKAFLNHIHKFNYCQQRYYELYKNEQFIVGTIVYTLDVNLFTFSKFGLKTKMNVIGIPVSIATEPVVGDKNNLDELLWDIIKLEKGLILGLNFMAEYCKEKVVNLRTLPTIVLDNTFLSLDQYYNKMRHNYRRKLKLHSNNFTNIKTVVTDCANFNKEHHDLYIKITNRTHTKLEELSLEFFKNLPDNFILTSHFNENEMLAWQICTRDNGNLFFFFGGMNYTLRDKYSSYYNNLLSIVKYAIDNNLQQIDLGQTAELVKLRMGGKISERKMFLFHKNRIVFILLKLFRGIIEYTSKEKEPNVFKKIFR